MAKEQPSFEDNLTQLNEIVTNLEKGDVPLEEALSEFQKGVTLSKNLQDTLDHAEKTLTKMMNEDNQEVPFEGPEGTDDKNDD
ncbi:exodeoxyribonuclease VII small subunit [Loigolactobacillus backii]|uniref:Exodeoxyribonuclease 7 small subunit n=1 Tax=Loigolactobacillus backii TaxID=375175 RepID=A0A192H3W2_9LACO|nr:exodeoxyribonuclease VII small subunit [Loigolactobacillus backii]ANK59361.1 exodeoxyribonuclease VII small subunit [Loigolactobacillus backii]ANK63060.1 exodeoxyribonuclease VII small subunit [Loigolactobacillus backii]ANK64354.1 exodeoxyribonuclease VII small subunit [Loigolactobacillus backii]ANK67250.1 exodeoxyribonuclease VII small subunit [Loigolactobacillus backii]ANK69932.1 exodeoxyribonuclease VII small subunit [Loigolactobacillus backii]